MVQEHDFLSLPFPPLYELVLLPNDEAGDTQFGGANAIIMAESPTSFAHDHGFQPAVTF